MLLVVVDVWLPLATTTSTTSLPKQTATLHEAWPKPSHSAKKKQTYLFWAKSLKQITLWPPPSVRLSAPVSASLSLSDYTIKHFSFMDSIYFWLLKSCLNFDFFSFFIFIWLNWSLHVQFMLYKLSAAIRQQTASTAAATTANLSRCCWWCLHKTYFVLVQRQNIIYLA